MWCVSTGLSSLRLGEQGPHQARPPPGVPFQRPSPHTRLLIGRQVLLKLDAQHLVLFAHLGQRVLQLDDLCAQLLLQPQLIALWVKVLRIHTGSRLPPASPLPQVSGPKCLFPGPPGPDLGSGPYPLSFTPSQGHTSMCSMCRRWEFLVASSSPRASSS